MLCESISCPILHLVLKVRLNGQICNRFANNIDYDTLNKATFFGIILLTRCNISMTFMSVYLSLYVPVNNFSVILGCFHGLNQGVLLKDTTMFFFTSYKKFSPSHPPGE